MYRAPWPRFPPPHTPNLNYVFVCVWGLSSKFGILQEKLDLSVPGRALARARLGVAEWDVTAKTVPDVLLWKFHVFTKNKKCV